MRNEKPYLLIFKLWQNLSEKRKFQTFLLIILMIFSGLTDLLSLGSVIPFTTVIIEPELIIQNNYYPFLAYILRINSNNDLILKVVILFIISALLAGLFRLLYLWFSLRLSANIGNDLSSKAFINTIYQPYSKHLGWNSSKLITSIAEKTNMTVVALYSTSLMISAFFLSSLLASFLILTHPYISLLFILVFISTYSIFLILTKKRLYRNGAIMANNVEKRHQLNQEAFGAIRDLILDGSHEVYFSAFRKLDRSIRVTEAESTFISSSPRAVVESVGLVLIALLSFFLISKNNNPASVLPFLAALTLGVQKFLPAIQQIYGGYSQLRSFYSSIKGVLYFVEQKISKINSNKQIIPFDFKKLELINISFSYPKNNFRTISNLDLTINKGERIGIIGPSGCGKSTLMDIILGLIEPTEGDFKINHKNYLYKTKIGKDNLIKWRKSIAHVPQFIFINDSTILENIAFGLDKKEIDYDKVQLAAKQAQIHNFITDLNNGYETKTGERGVLLSGGQRQRLGIARALYKGAKILILDEATSSLDNMTEKKVIESINNLSEEITVIIVAHRLSSLVYCNKIINLGEGFVSSNENNVIG